MGSDFSPETDLESGVHTDFTTFYRCLSHVVVCCQARMACPLKQI